MADGGGILGVVFVYLKRKAVVAIQAVLGADPKVAPAILKDGQTGVLREAIFNGKVLELNDAARGDVQVDVVSRLWERRGAPVGERGKEKDEGNEGGK